VISLEDAGFAAFPQVLCFPVEGYALCIHDRPAILEDGKTLVVIGQELS